MEAINAHLEAMKPLFDQGSVNGLLCVSVESMTAAKKLLDDGIDVTPEQLAVEDDTTSNLKKNAIPEEDVREIDC